ncbi:hypothetical protein SK128_027541, partial [Halocaridina rubra]
LTYLQFCPSSSDSWAFLPCVAIKLSPVHIYLFSAVITDNWFRFSTTSIRFVSSSVFFKGPWMK